MCSFVANRSPNRSRRPSGASKLVLVILALNVEGALYTVRFGEIGRPLATGSFRLVQLHTPFDRYQLRVSVALSLSQLAVLSQVTLITRLCVVLPTRLEAAITTV